MAKGIPSKRKPPVKRLHRRYRPLKRSEPAGTYEVDNHAGVLFPKADRAQAIRQLRLTISFAAQSAIHKERMVRQERPNRRDAARRIVKLIDSIERQTGWLIAADGDRVSSISGEFVPAVLPVPTPGSLPPERLLSKLISDLRSIRHLRRQLLTRFTMRPAGRQKADPLAQGFIEELAKTYENYRGRRPPRGRSGPFVNLIAAAWRDLGFPIPALTPLEDWLGQKVEVLPDMSSKKKRSSR